ncbi:MAG: NAD(P)/FAD-dependent oxidoreductase, partial [Sedimentibacter sp.]
PEIDWKQAIVNKDNRVDSLVHGVNVLLERNKVDVFKGNAEFLNTNQIQIDRNQIIESEKIIIATGSFPIIPPVPGLDLPGILTSNEALSLKELPDSMLIMGGGVIGVELGHLFNTLGVKISIVEMEKRIISRFDKEITDVLHKTLIKQGIEICVSSKVVNVEAGFKVTIETINGQVERQCDSVLVVAGRKPESYIAKQLGINTNKNAITVNEHYQTSIPHIYAIGDVTGKGMLAHSASHQGMHAVDHALGLITLGRKQIIPSCVYTTPEIACVGKTEDEARALSGNIKVGKFPFIASGRATSSGNNTGFVKIIADEKYHQILGIHIIGTSATELIGEATMAVELECTAKEITNIIHAHPTMSEGIMEAAYQLLGKGIHYK